MTEQRKTYKTAVFDLDGTLLDTLQDLADADNYMLDLFSFPRVKKEQVRLFMGNGIRRLVELSVPGGAQNPRFEEAYRAFMAYYLPHCSDKTKLYDGMEGVLRELKARGVKMAIVSNKNYIACEELRKKYFTGLIDVAVGENESAGIRKKPYPDSVDAALAALSASKEGCVYVGDTEVDKQTADNCGLDCLSVGWGFRDRDVLERCGASVILDDVTDLLKFF